MKTIERPALVMLSVLALPAVASAQQPAKEGIPHLRGAQAMPEDLLKSLVGSWEGACRTWLEPGKLAHDSKIKGTMRTTHRGVGKPFLKSSTQIIS